MNAYLDRRLRGVDSGVRHGSSIVGVTPVSDLGVHPFPPTARRREGDGSLNPHWSDSDYTTKFDLLAHLVA